MSDDEQQAASAAPVSKSKKYRRDKPWDTDDIDHWKPVTFTDEDKTKLTPFLEESSFATLFPKYREKYLKEVWPQVTSALDKHGIACVLDLIEGSMTVKTTRKTVDPYILFKSRDLVKLLARSVPVQQAVKVLEDGTDADIVKIGNLVGNKERFVKRRQRLIGPNGNTLKAIELLSGCYILVQGNTVSVMGSHKGLKTVRRIILDCMKNVHPIYHIKEMMIKRELAKDDTLKNENWERFLPKFRKQSAPAKKKAKSPLKKREYTPFPPSQPLSKVDLAIESGEYFLKEEEKEERTRQARREAQAEAVEGTRRQRQAAFVAPKEAAPKKRRAADEQEVEEGGSRKKRADAGEEQEAMGALRQKLADAARAADAIRARQEVAISEKVGDYIDKKKKKKSREE